MMLQKQQKQQSGSVSFLVESSAPFLAAWFVMLGAGQLAWGWSYWQSWFITMAVMMPVSIMSGSIIRYAAEVRKR